MEKTGFVDGSPTTEDVAGRKTRCADTTAAFAPLVSMQRCSVRRSHVLRCDRMKVLIPEEERAVLAAFFNGSEGQAAQALEALAAADPSVGPLARALTTLAATREFISDDGEDAEDLLLRAILGEEMDATLRARLEDRLERVLAIDAIGIQGKARYLQSSAAALFVNARVVSDLRPVFRDPDLEPAAVVVMHQLRVAFQSGLNGELEHLSIALDTDDLEALRDVIERALAKDRSLRAYVTGKGVTLAG